MPFTRVAGHGTGAAAGLVLVAVATLTFGLSHTFREAAVHSSNGRPGEASPSPSTVAPDRWAPVYPMVTKSGALIGGEMTDVYLPLPGSAGRAPEPMPVTVLLGAPRVSTTQYEQLAHDVAAYGTIVVVPRSGTPTSRVGAVRAWADEVVTDDGAPARELVDPHHVLVLAHGSHALSGSSLSGVDAVAVHAGRPEGHGAGAYATVSVAHADAMAATDEGIFGPRSSVSIDPARDRVIAEIAHWSALWLLSRTGGANDEAFAQYLASAPDAHVQVRTPAE